MASSLSRLWLAPLRSPPLTMSLGEQDKTAADGRRRLGNGWLIVSKSYLLTRILSELRSNKQAAYQAALTKNYK